MNTLRQQLSRLTSNLLLGFSLTAIFYSPTFAADVDWPKKPIVAILTFPAGGSTDIFARAVSAPLGEALGQSIIIENNLVLVA